MPVKTGLAVLTFIGLLLLPQYVPALTKYKSFDPATIPLVVDLPVKGPPSDADPPNNGKTNFATIGWHQNRRKPLRNKVMPGLSGLVTERELNQPRIGNSSGDRHRIAEETQAIRCLSPELFPIRG